MQAIRRFLLESGNPLDILGINHCPHCGVELTRGMCTTKEQNGTFYYYHLNCVDPRPIGSIPSNSNDMLRGLWTTSKSCSNPKGMSDYITNKPKGSI
jgi:hypothetical protein